MQANRIITLISDWQADDFYVAAIKGLLHSKCEHISVVDITHKIENYKYTQAAFVLKNAYLHFPKGTIHIVAINCDISEQQPPICIKYNDHFFVGTANGIFSLVFSEKPEAIVKINNSKQLLSTFPELNLYAQTAAFIANGGDILELGPEAKNTLRYAQALPMIDEDRITGSVIYFDSYKNVFTNITKDMFEQACNRRKFTITVTSPTYSVNRISTQYNEVEIGQPLAVFNSLGLLEIAMRNVRMAELLDIRLNSPVIIKFL